MHDQSIFAFKGSVPLNGLLVMPILEKQIPLCFCTRVALWVNERGRDSERMHLLSTLQSGVWGRLPLSFASSSDSCSAARGLHLSYRAFMSLLPLPHRYKKKLNRVSFVKRDH